MADNDNRNLIILALGMTGIVVAFFAYLIYNQNKEKERMLRSTLLTPPTSSISNEQLYDILRQQQEQLDRTLSLQKPPSISNEQLYDMLKHQQEQLDYISNTKPSQSTIQKTEPSVVLKDESQKAGNVSNLRANPGDMVRKLKFNMI